MKKIFLLGIGRNTPVFIDLAEQSGYEILGLYHYNESKTGQTVHGYHILGSFNDLYKLGNLTGMNYLLTMSDNIIRVHVAERLRSLGGETPNVIHPTAIISRFAKISEGIVISPFSYVQAYSEVGKDTIILSGVNISHNNLIGKGCFIAGGATIGAYTTLRNYVFVGQGALTVSGKVASIGNKAYIGAGSLVTKSVSSGAVIAGRPAKPIFSGNRIK